MAGRFTWAGMGALIPLTLVALVVGDRAGAGPASWADDLAPIGPAEWSYERAAHLLERAGFGGTPEEIRRLAAMTPAEAVRHLVRYQAIDNSQLLPFEHSG